MQRRNNKSTKYSHPYSRLSEEDAIELDEANKKLHQLKLENLQAINRQKDNLKRLEDKRISITLNMQEILKTRLSSDEFGEFISAALGPADVLCTWGPRYAGVYDTIMHGPGHVGSFIELTSHNIALAVIFYVVVGIASSYNLYRQYQQRKSVTENKQNIHQMLMRDMSSRPTLSAELHNFHVAESIADLNRALEKIVKETYVNKYDSIKLKIAQEKAEEKIQAKDIQIIYRFKNNSNDPSLNPSFFQKMVNKVISPLYTTSSLAAFGYWILWITAALTVGSFADAGIAGLSPIVAFGIPAIISLPYIGIKVKNYFQNRKGISDEHARLTKVVEMDNAAIFDNALKQMQYDRAIKALEAQNTALCAELERENKEEVTSVLNPSVARPSDKALGINQCRQTMAASYTTVISQVGLAQYNAWIWSDFFKVGPAIAFAIPYFGEIVGGILIAVGIGLGIREGYTRYQAAKKQTASDAKAPAEPLSVIFNKRIDELKTLNDQRNQFITEMEKKFPSDNTFTLSPLLNKELPKAPKPMTTKQWVYNFFDWSTTGIFFARLMCVAGTAIFLPFAALALSNPVTIGILAVSGVAFFAAKLYQAKQKQKAVEAAEYIAKIKEMDQQIHVAKMTQTVLNKQQLALEQRQHVNHPLISELTSEPALAAQPSDEKRTGPVTHHLTSANLSVGTQTTTVVSPALAANAAIVEDKEEKRQQQRVSVARVHGTTFERKLSHAMKEQLVVPSKQRPNIMAIA